MSTEFEERRQSHAAAFPPRLFEAIGRIGWNGDQLIEHRESKLKALLAHAKTSSPWHATRLVDLNPEAFTEADLPSLPTMSKDDLMDNWDQIVTDDRLTLSRCREHIRTLEAPADLDDRFFVVASGGTSGRRGIFVNDWEELATIFSEIPRWSMRRLAAQGANPNPDMRWGVLGSGLAYHSLSLVPRLFAAPGTPSTLIPVDLPVSEMTQRLEATQPELLAGYASALRSMGEEALAGRLEIAPLVVVSTSEPLLPDTAEVIRKAWGLEPINSYATCDAGAIGSGCGFEPGIHLNSDAVAVEPIDSDANPVGVGETSDKILVTPFDQRVMPLIRYEISDQVTPLSDPCACGCTFPRIADLQSRLEDHFEYPGGVRLHPLLFIRVFGSHPEVTEYQVRQTDRGVDIDIRAMNGVNVGTMEADIESAMKSAGMSAPQAMIRQVTQIPRSEVGKLKRFVAMT